MGSLRISIALCTYNGEKFLPDQLESIRKQTRLPDEMVVCDDCSSDGTLEILRAFAESVVFPVHIHRNDRNLGSTKNFEKAIGLCSGDIIALCDQDDLWLPHKLEHLVSVLQAHPEAGYTFSDAKLVDENLRPLGLRLWESVRFYGEIKASFLAGDQFPCLLRQDFVTGATMAFRASVGKLAMPFPTTCHWIHDGWLALVSSATGRLGIPIEEPLIDYRQHSRQQIGAPTGTNEKNLTLLGMYRELKAKNQALFGAWKEHCLQILRLKDLLGKIQESHNSPALRQSLGYLQKFETHFLAREKILTTKDFGRYGLILREVFAGRYALFSDSWRSIFRDLFL